MIKWAMINGQFSRGNGYCANHNSQCAILCFHLQSEIHLIPVVKGRAPRAPTTISPRAVIQNLKSEISNSAFRHP